MESLALPPAAPSTAGTLPPLPAPGLPPSGRGDEPGGLARGGPLEDGLALHHDADAPAGVGRRRPSEEAKGPGGGLGEPLQEVEERRLAGAVRAEQGDQAGPVHRERDASEGGHVPEPLREVLHFEHRHGVRTYRTRASRGAAFRAVAPVGYAAAP